MQSLPVGVLLRKLQLLASKEQEVKFISEKKFYIILENAIQTLELQNKRLLSLGDNNKMFIMSS